MAFRERRHGRTTPEYDEHFSNYHDPSHGDTCGLKGQATYLECQGGCGVLLPFPSELIGERAYYCNPCWQKRQEPVAPSPAEVAHGWGAIERTAARGPRPEATPAPETLYVPTPEELAWAREQIAQQKAAVGL